MTFTIETRQMVLRVAKSRDKSQKKNDNKSWFDDSERLRGFDDSDSRVAFAIEKAIIFKLIKQIAKSLL